MPPRSTREVVDDLMAGGRLLICEEEVSPDLELAEIQRRVYLNQGPAVLFTRLKGCRFPAVSNLFGSLDQARYLFRRTLDRVRTLIEMKTDPGNAFRRPWQSFRALPTALRMIPRSVRSGPVMAHRCLLNELPQIRSWPEDGGPFITLPQVLTLQPGAPSLLTANLGMYRVQLAGNHYEVNQEVGLHYQIRRGIGVHHRMAIERGEPLPVAVTVGGAPAMTLAAVMPLPEGLGELTFAGALGGRAVRVVQGPHAAAFYADADFAIVGSIDPKQTKPEGPFGDHLGYYSLQHPFPVMRVEQVYHREGAIWPFTVVGRPPQEDTSFGQLIHELTGTVIPRVLPGVDAVHAVDAAGVHPLLLAIGSERFSPYRPLEEPQELLTQAHAILGQGQLALAKYLWIANRYDDPKLDIDDVEAFFRHMLERVDWRRDLHFQTHTTIDTLDYSGSGLDRGSKVVIAGVGSPRRVLPSVVPADLRLADGYSNPSIAMPGVLVVQGPPICNGLSDAQSPGSLHHFVSSFDTRSSINSFPLVLLVDDSEFTARSTNNWVWVAFTRSNPARDLDGIGASTIDKHWGCTGSLVLDARRKPQHAPPLVEDPAVTRRIDALAARGGALSRYL
jgi:4-hydroxy-3-polyprenylbenzoate decarboxylase